ncbi:hypothetical protein I4U23_020534 [Adineta vaga]|nr:hypothetical protein I4U23_020534 [Adineta vaga]
MSFIKLINRNRSQDRTSKQPSISSISSHVPLMMTDKNDENLFLTQSLKTMSTAPDLHNFLQSFPMTTTRDGKRSRTICQPKGTISYTINDGDTLEKVALQFNSTPSELLQLNKLSTRTIFPGQTIFVPEECPSNNSDKEETTNTKSSTSSPSPPLSTSTLTAAAKHRDGDSFVLLSDRRLMSDSTISSISSQNQSSSQQDVGPMVWSMGRQLAARPGHVQRLNSDPISDNDSTPKTTENHSKDSSDDSNKSVQLSQKFLSTDENHHLDDECLQRFIKTNVRLMTEDRQTVAGTLLVTPNAVMFDPDVLDPLVKEHGIINYGLIIRMDFLARIALYDDLSIYEHEATFRDDEKRKMWHSTSVKHAQLHSKSPVSISDEEEIQYLMTSLLDKIDKELNSSKVTDTQCKLFDTTTSKLQRNRSKTLSGQTYDTADDDNDAFRPSVRTGSLSDDSYQPFDEYKHSLGILLNDNEKNVNKTFNQVPTQISRVFDWTRFRRAVKIKKGFHLENCVSLDEFNKRFGEIDKLLHQQQLNYCSPPPIEIPYYLCLKTCMHTDEIPSLHARPPKKSYEKTAESILEKKQSEQEYWFSVPKEKIDQLYRFFLRWKPEHEFNSLIDDESYSSDIGLSKHTDQTSNKGFVLLVNNDPELNDDYQTSTKNNKQQKQVHYLKRQNTLLKEWEIINVDEIYRRFNSTHSNEPHVFNIGIPTPKLLQPSILINEELSKKILVELPNRLHSLDWCMVFSTEAHGFSLSQLYRRSLEFDHDMPVLVIVKDVKQNIFGAFVPHQLVVKEGVYGTGESFLFTLLPEFRVFNWTGDNDFFVKGDLNSIGFGIGEGTYGLWFDADLYHGRTCPCKTFNNEYLTSSEDFIIASIEVWTFID